MLGVGRTAKSLVGEKRSPGLGPSWEPTFRNQEEDEVSWAELCLPLPDSYVEILTRTPQSVTIFGNGAF